MDKLNMVKFFEDREFLVYQLDNNYCTKLCNYSFIMEDNKLTIKNKDKVIGSIKYQSDPIKTIEKMNNDIFEGRFI